MAKPVVTRRAADEDLDRAFEYYLREAGSDTAVAFIDSLEQAILHISRQPASGSPSYAHLLDIPGLRFWKTKNFPYLIFYIDLESHIEIWRVLHGKMNIPKWMTEDE